MIMFMQFENKIDSLIAQMTLKEKIGQLNQIYQPRTKEQIENCKRMIRNGEVGSIILAASATAGNDKQSNIDTEIGNELQRVAVEEGPNHIPIIYGRDVIHGHHTVYPFHWRQRRHSMKNWWKNVTEMWQWRPHLREFIGLFLQCWI